MSPNLTLRTQAWRFIVTGGLSAIVDFGLYVALLAAGLSYLSVVPAQLAAAKAAIASLEL